MVSCSLLGRILCCAVTGQYSDRSVEGDKVIIYNLSREIFKKSLKLKSIYNGRHKNKSIEILEKF